MSKLSSTTMLVSALIVSVFCFAVRAQPDEIVLENATFRLVVGADAVTRSLVVKSTGEECLDCGALGERALPLFTATQDRPFNNELKLIHPNKRTTYPACSLRLVEEWKDKTHSTASYPTTNCQLVVGFPHKMYEAKVRVKIAPSYLAFELVDFICDHKMTYDYLKMDIPPVVSFRVLQLPVAGRKNFGDWLNAVWDDKAAVCVAGASSQVDIDHETHTGHKVLFAELTSGIRLRGGCAALIAAPGREAFLDAMDLFERDFGLPRGVASRRGSDVREPIFHLSGFDPKTIDEVISYAKRGGFRLMTFDYSHITKETYSYGRCGDYDWRDEYPNGEVDVKAMLAKVKAAGIRPGFHTLHSHIGLESRYVTPVADPRLNKTRRFTLAASLPAGTNDMAEVAVFEPTADTVMFPACRVLQFGGELLSYESYTTEPPYKFLGVKRGVHNTRPSAHSMGEIGGILDLSEFGWPNSCYIDQNTDLQDEVAAKLAKIYNCGFEYVYLDGSEGVNRPFNYHVANAQYRYWRLLKPEPSFGEGAAKTHFGWHMLAGANAFDAFRPEEFKTRIVEFPCAQAPITWQDMTRVDFGWWYYYLPSDIGGGKVKTIGTQPDMWEFGVAKAAAWDCAATVTMPLDRLRKHPRTDDILETMRRWNDARRRGFVTEEWKCRLRDCAKEHHLLSDGKGGYELVEWVHIPVAGGKDRPVRAFLYEKDGCSHVIYWHVSGCARIDLGAGHGVLDAAEMKTWNTCLPRNETIHLFNNARIVGEWDFTKGLPLGCSIRRFTVLLPGKGLLPAQIADRNGSPAGVEAERFTLPETFLFEAEFTPYCDWTNETDRVAADTSPRQHILWDTMGVNYRPARRNQGLQILFSERNRKWTPELYAGFGDDTCCVSGPTFEPKKGCRVKFAIRYDAFGEVEWMVNGEKKSSRIERFDPIASTPGVKPVIGDRLFSCYAPFNGTIHRVAITPLPKKRVAVRPAGRRAFERGETHAVLKLNILCADEKLKDVEVSAEQLDPETRRRFASVVGKVDGVDVSIPVETRLRPGAYEMVVTTSGRFESGEQMQIRDTFTIWIGPDFADRMPVVMWIGGSDEDVRDFGFTHVLRGESFNSTNISPLRALSMIDKYDNALAHGIKMIHDVNIRYPVEGEGRKQFYRLLRDGKAPTYSREIDQPEVSNPKLVEHARRIVAAENKAVGYHPAFAGVLPMSELRDMTFPSFNTEHLRYKAETGRDVPAEVHGKTVSLTEARKRFPDGVVPVDDPLYAYYSWFWGGGDGWPRYTGGIAEEYRKTAGRYGDGSTLQRRRPFFSFWDPAVRCPPKWGSGGDVDVLSQWVYAVPEPMNVAGPAEEVLAMVEGRQGQVPMIMTQLICYRVQTAPTNVVVAPLPEWVKRRPRASFPTIPADSLQEAVWSMLAKPVKGIMFHGWNTIFETGTDTGYTYTCPETAVRMKDILRNVVVPLGPTLKDLGRKEPEVAVLESFATAVFGGPASWGWLSPAITFMQRARLDPRVVYEETIMRDGFGGTKILYAPQCAFLSAPVVEKIREFQKAGGILVADEMLLPALNADVVVPVISYKNPPASDHTEDVDASTKTLVNTVARTFTKAMKAEMLENAESLRKTLTAKCGYVPKADSSSPEIVVYSRDWNSTPYIFAINDKRTFGDYVGQWGLTMEKGLPFSGNVTLADPEGKIGVVYELSRGGEVKFTRKGNGSIEVPLSYDTNDGRILMFLEHKIAAVEVEWRDEGASRSLRQGGDIIVTMKVCDDSGRPVPARLPVEIRVFDAAGAELDGAGYACAEGGICTLKVHTNLNDAPGGYRVVCRDRASGIAKELYTRQ